MNIKMSEIVNYLQHENNEATAKYLADSMKGKNEEKKAHALEVFAVIRCVSQIWNGIPIGVSKHIESDGNIFTPFGSDSPDRSALIEPEDGIGTIFHVAYGNRAGTMIHCETFSTNEESAIDTVRNWVINGRTPLEAR